MKTKIHKVTLLVVDHDNLDAPQVRTEIEAVRYPNRCIAPRVMRIETKEVDWDDGHPLNRRATQGLAFDELFPRAESKR